MALLEWIAIGVMPRAGGGDDGRATQATTGKSFMLHLVVDGHAAELVHYVSVSRACYCLQHGKGDVVERSSWKRGKCLP